MITIFNHSISILLIVAFSAVIVLLLVVLDIAALWIMDKIAAKMIKNRKEVNKNEIRN